MIKYPKNYEEAQIIIKNSTNDELTTKIERTSKLKAILFTAMGLVGSTLFLTISGSPISLLASLPLSISACAPSIAKCFINMKIKRDIKNGKYFEGKSEQEIIDKATEYAKIFNDYEEQKTKEIEEKKR